MLFRSNVYSSPDGAIWTSATSGGQGTLGYTGMAWSGSELVIAISNSASSSSTVKSSTDGVTWATLAAGGNRGVTKVMWDDAQFVYYGDGSSTIYRTYTYDQASNTMVQNASSISGYRLLQSGFSYNMVIVDGLYVIPGYQTDTAKNYFYTSTDLVTFSIPEYPGLWSVVNDSAPTTWQNINTLN